MAGPVTQARERHDPPVPAHDLCRPQLANGPDLDSLEVCPRQMHVLSDDTVADAIGPNGRADACQEDNHAQNKQHEEGKHARDQEAQATRYVAAEGPGRDESKAQDHDGQSNEPPDNRPP